MVDFDDTARQLNQVSLTPLTLREKEVLALLAMTGGSNRDLADWLYLSENTVSTHIQNIQFKLGARSKTELVAAAWRSGWMSTRDLSKLHRVVLAPHRDARFLRASG